MSKALRRAQPLEDAAPCPCRGPDEPVAYGACCGRFHRGGAPSDPRELVRARFSAFVLGELPFIRATESSDRPPIDALDARTRYKRLVLLDAELDPVAPRVLFSVDVLSRGADVSFVELSSFAIENERLVYVTGLTAKKRAGSDLAPLSIADFEARIR